MMVIVYALMLYWLARTYIRLGKADEASLEFQRKVDERIRFTKFIKSRAEFKRILMVGIIAGAMLMMFSVFKLSRLI